jgi:hypothetical protein
MTDLVTFTPYLAFLDLFKSSLLIRDVRGYLEFFSFDFLLQNVNKT